VDAAAGVALVEGGEEERGALGGVEGWWRAEVDALVGVGLRFEREDVDIFGLHKLFLDAGRREVDKIILSNARSSSSTCNPAQVPKLFAERRDEVGGVFAVVRRHKMVIVVRDLLRRFDDCHFML